MAASETRLRRWRWNGRGPAASAPVRCKRDSWYLVRGVPRDGRTVDCAAVTVRFLDGERTLTTRAVTLARVERSGAASDGPAPPEQVLGWVCSPERATHLQVDPGEAAGALERLVLHAVAERDPKCHPYANPPRWSEYRPPGFERVLLPRSLAGLAPSLAGLRVEWLDLPASLSGLADRAAGSYLVLDPAWTRGRGLSLKRLQALAARCWLIVDLETLARAAQADGIGTKVVEHRSAHGLMSARVEYADAPTRGFALLDVFPYGALTERDGFAMRVLRATRAWKRYADGAGFATLLAGETPWEDSSGDVLCAACPTAGGELIASDVPWLVAGRQGPPAAPRLAEHLLRMLTGQPLDDMLQYWNRWDDGAIVVRDIADLARRYPELRAVRWVGRDPGVARLGLALDGDAAAPGADAGRQRRVLLQTGRIDALAPHDGVPPEAMMILMRNCAREVREQTAWARRLRGIQLTWQFDTADGLKYVPQFEAASGNGAMRIVRLRHGSGAGDEGGSDAIELRTRLGLHGDGSLALQAELTAQVRALVG